MPALVTPNPSDRPLATGRPRLQRCDRADPGAAQRLDDILAAAQAIRAHLKRGGLDDGLVFDAVRVRLIEIGEAVRAIDPEGIQRAPVNGQLSKVTLPCTQPSCPSSSVLEDIEVRWTRELIRRDR